MEEIIRPHRTSEGSGPSGLGDPLAPTGNPDAYVVSGHYAEQLPVGGMSVGEIRRRYGDRFDLDPQSQAYLDGNQADENATVQPGQMLMFTRRSGIHRHRPGLFENGVQRRITGPVYPGTGLSGHPLRQ